MTYRDYGALRAEELGPYMDQPPHLYSYGKAINRFEEWLGTIDITPGAATVDPTNAEFGAVGDATAAGTGTDDTAAFQAAIDYLESLGGGILRVPPGGYLFSDPLTITKPIQIIGAGIGEDGTGVTGATDALTMFVKKPGTASDDTIRAMLQFGSATAANYLNGCGAWGVKFVLNGITGAIHLRRCQRGSFGQLVAAAANGDFLDPDTKRGIITLTQGSRFNTFYDMDLQVTNEAACIFLDGEDATYPACTQNRFITVRCTYGAAGGDGREGAIVLHGNCDNNIFDHVHCFDDGTGPVSSGIYGVVCRDGATAHARANVFSYCVAHIFVEDNCDGNLFCHMPSEAGSLRFETPASPPTAFYDVRDYGDWRHYVTRRYVMSDTLFIGAGQFEPGGGSAIGTFGLATCIDLAADATEYAVVTVPAPTDWDTGDITGCTVHYATTSGTEGQIVTLRGEIATFAVGEAATDKNSGADTDDTLGASPGTKRIDAALTVTGVDFTIGDMIAVKVSRIYDGNDNATGDIHFLGVTLAYQSDGPTQAGGGPYQIPARST